MLGVSAAPSFSRVAKRLHALVGGDKSSQDKDIRNAKALARELEEKEHDHD
jgi:putative component of toxin-antitoxin plasmid stabilization module